MSERKKLIRLITSKSNITAKALRSEEIWGLRAIAKYIGYGVQ